MKKTQWLALFQDIKATAVSFLSIVLFVALGIAVFLGIKWNEPALTRTADAYYAEHSFHDFLLTFPYGLTKDEVEAVAALDAVSDAEGTYSAHGTAWVGGKRYVLVVQSLTERIDTATALTGVLPAAPDEVGVEKLFAEAAGLKLGDTLSIEAKNGERAFLNGTDFTITAIVEHPSYIRPETHTRGLSNIGDGTVDYYVLMSPAAFNPDAYENSFPQLALRSAELDGLPSFQAMYATHAETIAEQLKALGAKYAPIRSAELLARYRTEISDGEIRIADAEKELADGKRDYEEGKQTIIKAEREIADGEREIAANEQKLADAEKTYAEGQAEYEKGENKLSAGRTKLRKGLKEGGFSYKPETARVQAAEMLDALYQKNREVTELVQLLDEVTALLESINYELTTSLDSQKAAKILSGLGEAGIRLSDDQINDLKSKLSGRGLDTILDDYKNDPASLSEAKALLLVAGIKAVGITPIELTSIKPKLANKQAEALDGLGKLREGIQKLLILIDAIDAYLDGTEQMKAASHKMLLATNRITESREAMEAAKEKLATAKQDLETGKSDLADADKKLSDGEIELTEKKTMLADAKETLSSFVSFDGWTLQKRTDNPGFATAKAVSEATRRMCFSMALLFVFVGLMVCYTSVSRIVHESQTLTGVQKALGFRNKEIVAHYMTYSVLAVLLGVLLGALLGYFGIETIVNASYARNFVFDRIGNVFVLPDLLAIAAVELFLICAATWIACRKLLKRQAVDLLRGDDHGGGRTRFYEKWGVWQKCSLYTQTTVNNLVSDSARVVASLVGVAGCTALVVMALSSQLALVNTPKKHFADVWRYDARLVSDNRVPGAQDALRAALEKEDVRFTPVLQESIFIEDASGQLHKADMIVPEEPERLNEFVRLSDWKSREEIPLPEEGVLVSRTYQKHSHVRVGDTLSLLDMKGQRHECVVAGVTEHYLSTNQIVMSRDYYARVLSAPAVSNSFYVNCGQMDLAALEKKLEQTDGYFSLINENAKWSAVFEANFKSTSLIVYICLFLSATMAMLVLLNLNVVFINEKARELIVMRINGFSVSATKKYIYRDNIVLTILGILLGIALGLVLAAWVLGNLQRVGDNFYTAPNIVACLVGAGLSAVFSLVTNLIALRKVDKLKASDLSRL